METQEFYDFLSDVMMDGWGVRFQTFEQMPEDPTVLDYGIRNSLPQAKDNYDMLLDILRQMKFGTVYYVDDSLRLKYVFARRGEGSEAFYAIGPFTEKPFEQEDYIAIDRDNALKLSNTDALRYLMMPVPSMVMKTQVMAFADNLLRHLHGVEEAEHETISLNLHTFAMPDFTEELDVQIRRVEETYAVEARLMKFIEEGNEAMHELEYFKRSSMDSRFPDLLVSRRALNYSSNTLYRKAAQNAGVHPYYLDKVSTDFARRINACTSHTELNRLSDEMVREYCRLAREQHPISDNVTVQRIADYIRFHLSEDLSPAMIADAVGFSPVYISRLFKDETGSSITAYIADTRVNEAKRLLEDTSMTVREISAMIGIDDWNYFTKVFRKHVGMTPTEYRRQIHHS